MKIVHLISSLKIGGAESALYNFLQAADRTAHEHVVYYFHHGPNAERITQLGIRTRHIRGFISPYDPQGLWRLFFALKAERADVLHTALWSANIIGSVMGALLRVPVVCDLHGDVRDHGRMRNFFERLTVRLPEQFVAVAPAVRDAFTHAITPPARASLVQVIENGIDIVAVRAAGQSERVSRVMYGLADDDFVIGSVGRLEAIKSYDVLIDSVAALKKLVPHAAVKLCLVGDGSMRESLVACAQRQGLARDVIFVGAQENAKKFYPLFDCFALSSQSEGLSIALLEALCFGLPIVTTHKTAQHDVITSGVHGFVVPPNDAVAFAAALRQLYESPAMRASMRQENERLVRERFGMQRVVQAYEKVYEKIRHR